jgi:DNA polymerase
MSLKRRPSHVHPASRWSGPVLVDFESRSRANLKACGGRRYWDDPSSEAICAVLYHPASGYAESWVPGEPAPQLEHAVAHNARLFDQFAAAASGWAVERWSDSSQAARRAGLPGGLDALAQEWLGRGKDLAGNKFTLSLSRPSRAKARKGMLPDLTPDVVSRVGAYCANDVEVMADAWDRLEPWFEIDAEACEVDAAINERGIYFDMDLVATLQRECERYQGREVKAAAKALGVSREECKRMARSPAVFAEMTGLPNAQKATLDDYLSELGEDEAVHPLVRARKALANIIPGKLEAARNRVSDDSRLRDSFLYYGSHTGRWSAKGVQLQNLTRVEWHDQDALASWLLDGGDLNEFYAVFEGKTLTFQQKLAAGMRACLTAPPGYLLAVLDYSLIEARVNAWQAGDAKALEVFKAYDAGRGPDPYCAMATKVFGFTVEKKTHPQQRQVGKGAVLGCGFQMGPDKFEGTCAKQGIDLAAAGVSAEDVVSAWRKTHKPIVQSWYAMTDAFAAACEGRDTHVGPYLFAPIGDGVACALPSGRLIMYRKAQAKRVRRQGKFGDFAAWDLKYYGQKQGHWTWVHAYGGLLCENAVQATARDLLADTLVRAERDGLDPVQHAHDEAGCQVPERAGKEGLEWLRQIMQTPPDWAKGLPVVADGFLAKRYRK